MTPIPLNVNDMNAFLDMMSPSAGLDDMYADVDQYMDASTSESHSPIDSNFDSSLMPELNSFNMYPSPGNTDGGADSPQPGSKSAGKPATKRKRENRYKNAPPAVLSRRRAQNRASQRAYRERKDQRIKDLETMVNETKQKNEMLSQAYSALHGEYIKLKNSKQNSQSWQPEMPFDPAIGIVHSNMGMYEYPEIPRYSL